jgi:hypothetical protein
LGGRDQEDNGSRTVWANSLRPYLENAQHKKRAGRVAQVVELLPNKSEVLNSIPSNTKKKKKSHQWNTYYVTI